MKRPPAVVRAVASVGLCMLSATLSVAQGGSDSQHYFFVEGNQHVFQFYEAGTAAQTVEDVTAAANAPLAASVSSALTSFALPGDTEYVFYLGSNQHVIQLYYSGIWKYFDLIAQTAGTLAASGSRLTSFADSAGQHVAYQGTNQHVYQLYYNPGHGYWVDQDLTVTAGGVLAASGSALTSFSDKSGGEHIPYLGANQHVYQLYYNPGWGYWVNQDLTASSGGAVAAAGTALTSFSDSYEHILYLGTNQHVYQLYYNPSLGNWVDQDLTALTGASPAISGSGLTSFSDAANYYYGPGGEHVFYLNFESNGARCYGGVACNMVTELLYNGTAWAAYEMALGYPPPASGAFALASLPGYDNGNAPDYEQIAYITSSGLVILEYLPEGNPLNRWTSDGGASTPVQSSLTSFIDP